MRVIVLIEETYGSVDYEDDEMSAEEVKASVHQALREAQTGQILPTSQL